MRHIPAHQLAGVICCLWLVNAREGSLEQQHDDKIVMKILSVLLFIEILPLGGKQIGNISQQE